MMNQIDKEGALSKDLESKLKDVVAELHQELLVIVRRAESTECVFVV